jgi:thymidylate synthase (FAD)
VTQLTRPNVPALDAILGHQHPVLDHGFVRLIDYMGDDAAVVQAARVSYGEGTETPSSDAALIAYLMRHRHSTPFEMCEIKLHVKLPIFVARQWIRHRTANVNEVSARYSILDREFYIPEPDQVQHQSTANKQGRSGPVEKWANWKFREALKGVCGDAFDLYDTATSSQYDIARETARIGLPLSTYTQWYWKVDLHNLLHFLQLRADPHAQYEIRVYADAILSIVEKWVPMAHAAFVEHRLGAVTFSKSAMVILRDILADRGVLVAGGAAALPKRERADFLAALALTE